MELKTFIAETLSEIQAGVQTAIHTTDNNKTNGCINPCWGTTDDINTNHIQNIDFDIAVTVSDKITGEAEAGIKVVGVSIGGGGSGSSEKIHISRIQFSIPIVPPVTIISNSNT